MLTPRYFTYIFVLLEGVRLTSSSWVKDELNRKGDKQLEHEVKSE
jgi:hypothetical protein